MSGGPAGMMHSRLKSGPVHFTPPPLMSSVMKTVEAAPAVDALVERSCAVPGRPAPFGSGRLAGVVASIPTENPRPGDVAVLAHSANAVGTFGNTMLKW